MATPLLSVVLAWDDEQNARIDPTPKPHGIIDYFLLRASSFFQLRRLSLYPAELRAQSFSTKFGNFQNLLTVAADVS